MKNKIKTMTNTTTRKIFFTFIFLLISSIAMAGNKTVKIKTSAICDMCKNRIELVVNNLKGVKKSMLNLNTGIIVIRYDDEKLTEVALKSAINDAGYDADELPANKEAYAVLPGCCKKGSSCDTRK